MLTIAVATLELVRVCYRAFPLLVIGCITFTTLLFTISAPVCYMTYLKTFVAVLNLWFLTPFLNLLPLMIDLNRSGLLSLLLVRLCL